MSEITRRHAIALMTAAIAGASEAAKAQAPTDWDKVIAAAKQEGSVIVYSSYTSDTHTAIKQAFEKKYGIKVDILTGRGSEVTERIRTEQAANRYNGDVWHTAIATLETRYQEDPFVVPHGGLPGMANLKPDFARRATPTYVPVFTLNYGILVNNRLVKEGDEPKGWLDLLDPKWQGKILADDPRASGGGRVMFQMTIDKFGKDYQEKLATQKLIFNRDYQESFRRVARGEFPLYVPMHLSQFQQLKGLPVRLSIPKEGVTYGSYASSVLKKAPHPNAARLMADFYLSDEAQLIYAKSMHGIVVSKLSETLPPDIEAAANVKTLVDENFAEIDQMLALAKQIYK